MYIAVENWGSYYGDERYISVFDTSDCSVEHIPTEVAARNRLDLGIKNFRYSSVFDCYLIDKKNLLTTGYLKSHNDFVTLCNDILTVGTFGQLRFGKRNSGFYINHEKVSVILPVVDYFFLFRENFVMRCHTISSRGDRVFFTVVVDKSGVISKYYTDKIGDIANKGLALQIETLSEV